MTVWWALFNEDGKRVKTVNKFLASTNVTRWSNHCTLSMTLLTLLLELLNKARSNLLLMDGKALTVTGRTLLYVRWVISTRTSAVRANNFTIVSHFVFFAGINLLQSQSDLQINWGSHLFLLLTKNVAENIAKWIHPSLVFWLIKTILTALVVFPSLVWITESFISSWDICKLVYSSWIILIFVWMPFQG